MGTRRLLCLLCLLAAPYLAFGLGRAAAGHVGSVAPHIRGDVARYVPTLGTSPYTRRGGFGTLPYACNAAVRA